MASLQDIVFGTVRLILNLWVIGTLLVLLSTWREFGILERRLARPWILDIILLGLFLVLLILLVIR